MKKFNYTGTGTIAFSDKQKDYVIQGPGPHKLPIDNDFVESLVSQELLIEIPNKQISNIKK